MGSIVLPPKFVHLESQNIILFGCRVSAMSVVKDFGMHSNGFRVSGGEMQGHAEKKAV